MRSLYAISFFGIALPLFALGHEHTPPPVQSADNYAAHENHPSENVMIAVEPFDTKEKASIFRIDYLSHGIMPVRLIVTNNSERPISLKEARILYVTPSGERIQAAEPEDVLRVMSQRERMGGHIPMPGPLPPIKLKAKGSLQDIQKDFDSLEYSAVVVEAHSTRGGFLFYDVSQLSNPLRGSKLLLRNLRDTDGHELFYFEIPFDKYLQLKSKQIN